MLAERLDGVSGRRWRYATSRPRVALAGALLAAGVALAAAAGATGSAALAAAAALALLPGAWAARVYVGVYFWGEVDVARPDVFFAVEEIA